MIWTFCTRGADDLVVCACCCTRPRPFFHRLCQPSLYRIPFHIPNHPLQFNIRPNPMVVRLILPESSNVQAQNPLSPFRSYTLQPLQNARHCNLRRPNHVHMVRHDDKSMQIIELACDGPVKQRVNHHLSYACVFQPKWAGPSAVQFAILGGEKLSGGNGRRQDRPPHPCLLYPYLLLLPRISMQCTCQSPGYENRLGVRYPMRKASLRIDHYDLRDPRRGFFNCDWRIFIFFRFGLLMANVPLP